MKRPPISLSRRQRGVSLISGIFIFLLLVTLAALMVKLTATAHTTAAEDVLGARAYQAARGGIEWGLYQVLDPDNTVASTAVSAQAALVACFCPSVALPLCPGINQASVPGLGAAVSVSCAASDYQEGSKRLRIYRITSTATLPGPGLVIERQLEVTAEKCRDGAATAPYDC